MQPSQRAPWSGADIDKLIQMYFSVPKPSIGEMAAKLGRTEKAVWTEISRLGMAKRGAAIRKCLGPNDCERPFFSTWIGHRICGYCESSEVMRCA
jgi:hypothetical protein